MLIFINIQYIYVYIFICMLCFCLQGIFTYFSHFNFHSVNFIFQLQCGCFNSNDLRFRELLDISAHWAVRRRYQEIEMLLWESGCWEKAWHFISSCPSFHPFWRHTLLRPHFCHFFAENAHVDLTDKNSHLSFLFKFPLLVLFFMTLFLIFFFLTTRFGWDKEEQIAW